MASAEASMIEPHVEFYGLAVPPGKESHIAPHLRDKEGCSVSVHLTQVALGADAAAGPHTVSAVAGKTQYAIGTLVKGRIEQFSVDYMCTTDVAFRNSGQSAVYLTGYRHISPILDTIGEEDQELYSSDEEPPQLKPLSAKQLAAARARLQNGRPAQLKENTFGDPLIEDPDDLEDDESSEEDEEEEEEEEEEGAGVRRIPRTRIAKQGLGGGDDDDEGSEDDEDDDDLLDDDDELDTDDEDAADVADPAALATNELLASMAPQAKRAAVSPAAAPAKKVKVAAAPAPAATAPSPQAGGPQASWAKSIKEYLDKNGATRLSELGSKVPKPAGIATKLKKVLDDSGLFAINTQTQTVSLK